MYGGYFGLFVNMLGEEGERWDMFRAFDRQLPKMEDLDKYDGFVVTGSKSDAHGNAVWILELCQLLRCCYQMRIKVLGICFGHQILSRALGGKVSRSSAGWDGSMEKDCIEFNKYCMVQVTEIPCGADIIAFSNKTEIEMFSMDDHILGIQGHPEYSSDILFNLMDNLCNEGILTEEMVKKAKNSVEQYNNVYEREIWQQICKRFLKYTII
ncbi:gamma-glutamyl peptidase 5-like [Cryptomeria japonica]|uniref:gamma-glutamyl peptidase 5-like n=1 Tax=Cryptomeria japonica TaxID=3369 RepID=UPI0027DA5664|nr:gamma-glutamyl peptidase 5-like [Cryptomeria japonica]